MVIERVSTALGTGTSSSPASGLFASRGSMPHVRQVRTERPMPTPAVVPMMAPTITTRLRICHLQGDGHPRAVILPSAIVPEDRRTADPVGARAAQVGQQV